MKPLTIIVEGNNRLPQTSAGHESDAALPDDGAHL
jgi:hypothetical protein